MPLPRAQTASSSSINSTSNPWSLAGSTRSYPARTPHSPLVQDGLGPVSRASTSRAITAGPAALSKRGESRGSLAPSSKSFLGRAAQSGVSPRTLSPPFARGGPRKGGATRDPILTDEHMEAARLAVLRFLASSQCNLFAETRDGITARPEELDQLIVEAGGTAASAINLLQRIEASQGPQTFRDFPSLIPAVSREYRVQKNAQRDKLLRYFRSYKCKLFSAATDEVKATLYEIDNLIAAATGGIIRYLPEMASPSSNVAQHAVQQGRISASALASPGPGGLVSLPAFTEFGPGNVPPQEILRRASLGEGDTSWRHHHGSGAVCPGHCYEDAAGKMLDPTGKCPVHGHRDEAAWPKQLHPSEWVLPGMEQDDTTDDKQRPSGLAASMNPTSSSPQHQSSGSKRIIDPADSAIWLLERLEATGARFESFSELLPALKDMARSTRAKYAAEQTAYLQKKLQQQRMGLLPANADLSLTPLDPLGIAATEAGVHGVPDEVEAARNRRRKKKEAEANAAAAAAVAMAVDTLPPTETATPPTVPYPVAEVSSSSAAALLANIPGEQVIFQFLSSEHCYLFHDQRPGTVLIKQSDATAMLEAGGGNPACVLYMLQVLNSQNYTFRSFKDLTEAVALCLRFPHPHPHPAIAPPSQSDHRVLVTDVARLANAFGNGLLPDGSIVRHDPPAQVPTLPAPAQPEPVQPQPQPQQEEKKTMGTPQSKSRGLKVVPALVLADPSASDQESQRLPRKSTSSTVSAIAANAAAAATAQPILVEPTATGLEEESKMLAPLLDALINPVNGILTSPDWLRASQALFRAMLADQDVSVEFLIFLCDLVAFVPGKSSADYLASAASAITIRPSQSGLPQRLSMMGNVTPETCYAGYYYWPRESPFTRHYNPSALPPALTALLSAPPRSQSLLSQSILPSSPAQTGGQFANDGSMMGGAAPLSAVGGPVRGRLGVSVNTDDKPSRFVNTYTKAYRDPTNGCRVHPLNATIALTLLHEVSRVCISLDSPYEVAHAMLRCRANLEPVIDDVAGMLVGEDPAIRDPLVRVSDIIEHITKLNQPNAPLSRTSAVGEAAVKSLSILQAASKLVYASGAGSLTPSFLRRLANAQLNFATFDDLLAAVTALYQAHVKNQRECIPLLSQILRDSANDLFFVPPALLSGNALVQSVRSTASLGDYERANEKLPTELVTIYPNQQDNTGSLGLHHVRSSSGLANALTPTASSSNGPREFTFGARQSTSANGWSPHSPRVSTNVQHHATFPSALTSIARSDLIDAWLAYGQPLSPVQLSALLNVVAEWEHPAAALLATIHLRELLVSNRRFVSASDLIDAIDENDEWLRQSEGKLSIAARCVDFLIHNKDCKLIEPQSVDISPELFVEAMAHASKGDAPPTGLWLVLLHFMNLSTSVPMQKVLPAIHSNDFMMPHEEKSLISVCRVMVSFYNRAICCYGISHAELALFISLLYTSHTSGIFAPVPHEAEVPASEAEIFGMSGRASVLSPRPASRLTSPRLSTQTPIRRLSETSQATSATNADVEPLPTMTPAPLGVTASRFMRSAVIEGGISRSAEARLPTLGIGCPDGLGNLRNHSVYGLYNAAKDADASESLPSGGPLRGGSLAYESFNLLLKACGGDAVLLLSLMHHLEQVCAHFNLNAFDPQVSFDNLKLLEDTLRQLTESINSTVKKSFEFVANRSQAQPGKWPRCWTGQSNSGSATSPEDSQGIQHPVLKMISLDENSLRALLVSAGSSSILVNVNRVSDGLKRLDSDPTFTCGGTRALRRSINSMMCCFWAQDQVRAFAVEQLLADPLAAYGDLLAAKYYINEVDLGSAASLPPPSQTHSLLSVCGNLVALVALLEYLQTQKLSFTSIKALAEYLALALNQPPWIDEFLKYYFTKHMPTLISANSAGQRPTVDFAALPVGDLLDLFPVRSPYQNVQRINDMLAVARAGVQPLSSRMRLRHLELPEALPQGHALLENAHPVSTTIPSVVALPRGCDASSGASRLCGGLPDLLMLLAYLSYAQRMPPETSSPDSSKYFQILSKALADEYEVLATTQQKRTYTHMDFAVDGIGLPGSGLGFAGISGSDELRLALYFLVQTSSYINSIVLDRSRISPSVLLPPKANPQYLAPVSLESLGELISRTGLLTLKAAAWSSETWILAALFSGGISGSIEENGSTAQELHARIKQFKEEIASNPAAQKTSRAVFPLLVKSLVRGLRDLEFASIQIKEGLQAPEQNLIVYPQDRIASDEAVLAKTHPLHRLVLASSLPPSSTLRLKLAASLDGQDKDMLATRFVPAAPSAVASLLGWITALYARARVDSSKEDEERSSSPDTAHAATFHLALDASDMLRGTCADLQRERTDMEAELASVVAYPDSALIRHLVASVKGPFKVHNYDLILRELRLRVLADHLEFQERIQMQDTTPPVEVVRELSVTPPPPENVPELLAPIEPLPEPNLPVEVPAVNPQVASPGPSRRSSVASQRLSLSGRDETVNLSPRRGSLSSQGPFVPIIDPDAPIVEIGIDCVRLPQPGVFTEPSPVAILRGKPVVATEEEATRIGSVRIDFPLPAPVAPQLPVEASKPSSEEANAAEPSPSLVSSLSQDTTNGLSPVKGTILDKLIKEAPEIARTERIKGHSSPQFMQPLVIRVDQRSLAQDRPWPALLMLYHTNPVAANDPVSDVSQAIPVDSAGKDYQLASLLGFVELHLGELCSITLQRLGYLPTTSEPILPHEVQSWSVEQAAPSTVLRDEHGQPVYLPGVAFTCTVNKLDSDVPIKNASCTLTIRPHPHHSFAQVKVEESPREPEPHPEPAAEEVQEPAAKEAQESAAEEMQEPAAEEMQEPAAKEVQEPAAEEATEHQPRASVLEQPAQPSIKEEPVVVNEELTMEMNPDLETIFNWFQDPNCYLLGRSDEEVSLDISDMDRLLQAVYTIQQTPVADGTVETRVGGGSNVVEALRVLNSDPNARFAKYHEILLHLRLRGLHRKAGDNASDNLPLPPAISSDPVVSEELASRVVEFVERHKLVQEDALYLTSGVSIQGSGGSEAAAELKADGPTAKAQMLPVVQALCSAARSIQNMAVALAMLVLAKSPTFESWSELSYVIEKLVINHRLDERAPEIKEQERTDLIAHLGKPEIGFFTRPLAGRTGDGSQPSTPVVEFVESDMDALMLAGTNYQFENLADPERNEALVAPALERAKRMIDIENAKGLAFATSADLIRHFNQLARVPETIRDIVSGLLGISPSEAPDTIHSVAQLPMLISKQ